VGRGDTLDIEVAGAGLGIGVVDAAGAACRSGIEGLGRVKSSVRPSTNAKRPSFDRRGRSRVYFRSSVSLAS
jgi:hypothetical protein